ncbi:MULTISPECIES: hypothetical protein [Pseudanabaena]|uniref:Uncharacterized protein n=2 Tax=Pseudanabaena TaxID=1152 RepID=L8N0A7_9CYAN|nr:MULTISPECIES: hypothetical protein [Pseudanabaena]ELS32170.1 hypothetical protein Pse7429DRAFT_2584 [Pseudanabaena biceps PCC 7429]MDG3495572.1 hypothetical protein [Pseudanabaena catenata USMAC16]
MTQTIDLSATGEFLSVSDLKKLHGFTESAIEKFLGECDANQPNPKSKSTKPVKLYSAARVDKVLHDELFIEWQTKKKTASSKRSKPIEATIEAVVANLDSNVSEIVTEATEVTEAIADKKTLAFDFDLGLGELVTADWCEFAWENFQVDGDRNFSEEEKLHAVTTVNKMLAAAYWFSPELFFDAFTQPIKKNDQNVNLESLAKGYKEEILAKGFKGIPLVTFMIRDRQDNTKVMLDSAPYKLMAIADLYKLGSLPADFRIPVFDLKKLKSMVRDKYGANLDFALKYAIAGGELGRDFALREISRNWLTSLCTGISVPL